MCACVYIHGGRGIVGAHFVCFSGKFACLFSLLFVPQNELKNFVMDWLNGLYDGRKILKFGL
jgi:hypothetical protein